MVNQYDARALGQMIYVDNCLGCLCAKECVTLEGDGFYH